MTYNTGNAVPSKDPRDLLDNAESLDSAVNSDAETFRDRLGRDRLTLAGMSSAAGDATLSIQAAERAVMAASAAEQDAARAFSSAVNVRESAEQIASDAAEQAVAGVQAAVEGSVDRADSAASRAESARDAAQLSSGVYPDTAAGIAAVVDGRYFSVPSTDSDESLILYRRQGSTAVEVTRYPSAALLGRVEGIEDQVAPYQTRGAMVDGTPALGAIAARDSSGQLREFMSFMEDGSARLLNIKIRHAEAIGWGAYVFAQRGADGQLYALQGVRPDGSAYPAAGGGSGERVRLHHIPFLGQSNAAADDALPAVSISPTGFGALMFLRGIKTWSSTDNPNTPASRSGSDFALVDMTASGVETRANAMADAYKARLVGASRYSPLDTLAGPRVLASFSGLGGRKLTELGPEDDGASGRAGARTPGGHWPTMLDDIARAKSAASAASMDYSLPAWVYDQGESEGDLTLYYGGPTLLPSEVISGYASRALAMAKAFDVSARAITGQARPVPLFVTPATYNQLTPTAWMDVADASPLVFIVGARYQMPSAKNASNGLSGGAQNWGNEIHYSPDGHRWIGEMCAKVIDRVVNRGEAWQPLRVLSARKVDATHIDLTLHVPRPPLVIDTEFLPKARGWGISIYGGSVDAPTSRQIANNLELLEDGRTVRVGFDSIPASALLSIGQSVCDLGAEYTVAAVGAGPDTANGFPTYTVAIDGDIRQQLAGLTNEGAFWVAAVLPNGTNTAQGVIRSVQYVGGQTVLTGEARELRTGSGYGAFAPGDALQFRRMNPYTNFRDSDNELSLNSFLTSPRAGQPYPLYNWLCQYEGMAIQGA